MPQRFALYYAPATTDPLWSRAAQWLDRDPANGEFPATAIPGIDSAYRHEITTSARRYGFHATLKAPMALAPGEERRNLEAALADFTGRHAPVPIGRLVLRFIDGFLALLPTEQTEELTAFAAAVVGELDFLRAPLSEAERERRLSNSALTAHQIELLDRYGYPYVMDEFRFHMTLTDRLPEPGRDAVMAAARDWFAPAIEAPFVLDRIALFHEPEAGAPFRRVGDFELARVAVDA